VPAITVIKFRKGTAAAWASANSVLAAGEPGLETDTNKFKFGDGTAAWNDLDYAGGGTASVVVSDTPPADPTADMVWFNSAEGTAYIRYDNTWVPLSPGIAGPAGPGVAAGGTAGQVLTKVNGTDYNTQWSAQSSLTIATSQVTGLDTALAGKAATSHTHAIDDLTDVTITTAALNQFLKYNGTQWVNSSSIDGGSA
jgi:hypothetical protein